MPDTENDDHFAPVLKVSSEAVIHHARSIGAATSAKDSAVMALATAFDLAEKAGVHKAAMKSVLKAQREDPSKRADFQRHFDFLRRGPWPRGTDPSLRTGRRAGADPGAGSGQQRARRRRGRRRRRLRIMADIIDLETIYTCPDCDGDLWRVIERRDTDGPVCRCANCGSERPNNPRLEFSEGL